VEEKDGEAEEEERS
jgi:hypothetical protein